MLNTETLKKIQTQLQAEKEHMEAALSSFASKSTHNPDDYNASFPEFGDKDEDNASEVAAFTDNLTIERTLESSLRDVKNSLKRIADGTYGTCKYCKKSIDEKRLLARPTSSACIDCKKQLTQEV
ncbi:MAG: TraR/DksA C4-type zinc finger protein [Patescibacteria group bacterium]